MSADDLPEDPKPLYTTYLEGVEQILTACAGAVAMNLVVTVEPPFDFGQDWRVRLWVDGTFPLENLNHND